MEENKIQKNHNLNNLDFLSIINEQNKNKQKHKGNTVQYQFITCKNLNTSSKKGKTILLKKRKNINQSSIKAQNTLNTDGTNSDNNYLSLQMSLQKKVRYSFIVKDFKTLQNFFYFHVQFRLIFRASDHAFSVQKFHQLCDAQTNTLVLCKTKNHQIIGGYTPLMWVEDYEESKSFFKTDKKNETFLFSVTRNEKYKLAKSNRNKAICCFRKWGPTFGGGYDLQIGNESNIESNSISYFPRSFEGENQYLNSKYFTGSKNHQFKITQWEVYKVVRHNEKKKVNKIKEQNREHKQSFLLGVVKGLTDLFT